MKINFYYDLSKRRLSSLSKILYRKTTIFLAGTLFISQVFGAASAQNITLNEKGSTLLEVLKKIRIQSGSDLIGDITLLQESQPIYIQVVNKDVPSVLEEISRDKPFQLIYHNNTIVVKPKPQIVSKVLNPEKSFRMSGQQRYVVEGIVTDKGGSPLKGVTVKLLNSPNWASVTSEDGHYSLEVQSNSEIMFSMLGFQSQTIKVSGRNQINIQLLEYNQEIDEVVVSTGYAIRKKESMTGASTTITRKELEKFNSSNIFSIIQSIDPAFKVGDNSSFGSNPNVLPEITVRGTNSVGEYAVNAPLVILDGFEVSLERLYDLDVNRIESISLLKDASSTVLYGSRGGNGVLIIETRLPKDGKFTVTYDLKPSVTAVDLSDYNLMTAAQKLEYEKQAGVYTFSSPVDDPYYFNREQSKLDNIYTHNQANVLRGVDTYWLAQPVQTTLSLGHNIRVEGGSNQVRYSIDGNYSDVKGAMKESGRQRAGAGFNLLYRVPGKVSFRNNASYQSTKAYNSPYGSFALYTQMNPYQPIFDDNGEIIIEYKDEFLKEVAYNPIYNAGLTHSDYLTNSVLTNNFSLEWYINSSLVLNSKAVIEKTFIEGEQYTSPHHSRFLEVDTDEKGQLKLSDGKGLSYYANIQMTYAKTFGKHAVHGNLIGEMNASDLSQTSHLLTGFASDNYVSPSFALQYARNKLPTYENVPSRLVGTVLTANYTYDLKYILDLSYRMDGSSKFGENNRYGNFWSAGLGYNLHHEDFFKDGIFSELRLFVNTGVNGADNFNSNMTATSYTISARNRYYKEIGLGYFNQGNPDLSWPRIRSTSAGLSGKLLEDRVTTAISVYKKTTDKMVSLISVGPSLGYANNSYYENMGKTQNKGFEASVSLKAYENQSQDFNWYVSATAVKNQSKLLEISEALKQLNENNLLKNDDENYVQTVYYQQGEPLNTIKGVRSLGIDPMSGREVYMSKDGNITYDWNAKDITIIGITEPKLFGNLSTTVNYRTLSIQAFFNYTLGGQVYNETLIDKIENVNPKMNADLRVLEERWQKPGDLAFYKAIDNEEKTQLTSRFVQKENHLRFSSLNINYDLPRELIQRYKLERFRLNFSMNDIFRLSTVRMERGTEYPFARTFNLGLMVQF